MIGINYLGKMKERLANQMFQYAAVKGIAKNRGFQYCIPPLNYDGIKDEWDEHQLFATYELNTLNPLQVQYMDPNRSLMIKEPHFHFSEDLFNNCPDNTCIVGYFQSEKYFSNVREELLQDFVFLNNLKGQCKDVIESVDAPVALHIRRTDYQQYSHHPIQPLSYYEEALSKFDDDREVIIFSDDPVWCHQQKLFDSDRFMISENDHLLDLCMMTLCSDFIIANSSFSWWGAWLSESKDKTVVAPKNWFGSPLSEQNDTKDLYCPGWVVI